MRKYEFFCRDCGEKYYLNSPAINICTAKDCLGNPLELVATVEWNEAMDGKVGISNWATDRKPIPRKPKS